MDKSNGDFIYQLCQLCGELTEFPSTRIFDSLIVRGVEVKEVFNL